MLRVIPLTLAIMISNAAIAAAEPQAGEDLATCRDRQAEAQVRATACDNLLKADKLGGKDKSLALVVRGNALINKRDYDRAIEALSSAIDLDPDNVGAINLRGLSHERKGEDDLAMVDYNLAIQKRANFGYAYNNRGTIHLRRGALQSALDDFNLSIKYTPTFLLGWTNRARMRTLNKDFDGAIADFAAAEKASETGATK